MAQAGGGARAADAWAPLRRAVFRSLWIAGLASNIGTWMQNVGAAWLMTALAPTPLQVSLVQAASSLPLFLLGVPAGALADVLDRRKLLLVALTWMGASAALLGALALGGRVQPSVLLALTFAIGLGTALSGPAFAAIVPDLVPREEIESAVSLNGISINLARALGPALGGVVVAAAGAGPTFLLNAASFGVVIGALALWRREPSPTRLPPEDLIGAMRAGLRFARYSGPLRLVLARVAAFVLPASAIWALLPLYARQEMGLGAAGYGVLLGCFGSGAVAGGVALPRLRAALGAQRLTTAAALAFAAANGVLGASSAFAAVAPALAVAGACWIAILSTLSAMAQLALPAWVRARGLSLSLLVTFGGLALGSAVWGGLAEAIGLPRTFLAAGAAVAASRLFVWRLRLPEGEAPDLTPAPRWPDPQLATSLDLRRGPVLVTVEYEVAPDEAPAFARAMDELRQIRLRDGAIRWGLWSDTGRPERQLESFVVESWVEHLRQHERITSADRAVQARIHAFHRGAAPPRVTHYVSEAVPSGR